MDVRDPSDQGLSWVPPDDPIDLDALRAPAAPPARPEQRRAVVDGVCRGQGWRASRSQQLAEPCACGAAPTMWCRSRGRVTAGFIHPDRGTKHLAGSAA